MSKNIAILVESYYRTPEPNGICTKVIADELVKQGHYVSVFTSKKGYNQPSFEIVDNVKVKRFNRSIAYMLRNLCEHYSGIIGSIVKLFSKIIFSISDRLLCFIWPLHSLVLVFKYTLEVNKSYKLEKYESIVGVYLHLEEVLAAILIKKIHPNIKLVVYTLDAMSGRNTPQIFGFKSILRKSIIRWEKFVFDNADKICVMESHKLYYSQSRYDNIRNKIKYMDIPLLKLNIINSHSVKQEQKRIIVYTGFLSEVTADPTYFLIILNYIKNVEFHIYGTRSKEIEKKLMDSGLLNRCVFLHGRKKHEDIIEIQKRANLLVNFGSSNDCMVPSKIFEYIATKKPIISFYKIENDASYPYIRKYPNSLLIREDISELDKNIQLIEKFIFFKNYEVISDEVLMKNFYNNTPYPMVNEIISMIC